MLTNNENTQDDSSLTDVEGQVTTESQVTTDDPALTIENDQVLDDQQHTEQEEENEDEEDVLEMAMAEKTNALIRGKSVDFDRTFVPRTSVRRSRPEDIPEYDVEQPNGGEEPSSSAALIHGRPGAFSVSQRNPSQPDSVLTTSAEGADDEGSIGHSINIGRDKTIVVLRASLVRMGSTDADSDMEQRREIPPIAEVVEPGSLELVSSVKPGRTKLFRILVVASLLLIAAALIAILVTYKTNQSSEEKRRGGGGRGDRPSKEGPPPDRYPNVDRDDIPIYSGGDDSFGNNTSSDRNINMGMHDGFTYDGYGG
jgi:hypothetical protein